MLRGGLFLGWSTRRKKKGSGNGAVLKAPKRKGVFSDCPSATVLARDSNDIKTPRS